jgi:hypothetical protein
LPILILFGLEQRRSEMLGESLETAVRFFRDGDAWCCVGPDFVSLAESPAGFGQTMEMAYQNLSDFEPVVKPPEYPDPKLVILERKIEDLQFELRTRPRVVIVDNAEIGPPECFSLRHRQDIVRCHPAYSKVLIDFGDEQYEFASAVFTRTPKERMSVHVCALVTGEVKIVPDRSTWCRTEPAVGNAADPLENLRNQ